MPAADMAVVAFRSWPYAAAAPVPSDCTCDHQQVFEYILYESMEVSGLNGKAQHGMPYGRHAVVAMA